MTFLCHTQNRQEAVEQLARSGFDSRVGSPNSSTPIIGLVANRSGVPRNWIDDAKDSLTRSGSKDNPRGSDTLRVCAGNPGRAS